VITVIGLGMIGVGVGVGLPGLLILTGPVVAPHIDLAADTGSVPCRLGELRDLPVADAGD
jgi:hypothetical protein